MTEGKCCVCGTDLNEDEYNKKEDMVSTDRRKFTCWDNEACFKAACKEIVEKYGHDEERIYSWLFSKFYRIILYDPNASFVS